MLLLMMLLALSNMDDDKLADIFRVIDGVLLIWVDADEGGDCGVLACKA